ncbi:MAG: response regulator [Deltaproteobacteria bacterium]|nr:response regulator [Deltaproteobacteria bacterium]
MNQTVMIVDDSLFMRNILRGIVQEKGYVVVAEAASGIEAMKNLHTHKPDLILLDIVLPDSNDLELLESIVAARPQAAVVLCSAIGQEDVIRKALDIGAKAFLQKPFNPEKVIQVLENLGG